MPGFISQFADANNNPFQQQVTMALMNYATTVALEVNTTPNHTARLALLTEVFNNLPGYTYKFALLCTANGLVAGTATDAQILNIVGIAWTDLAGVI